MFLDSELKVVFFFFLLFFNIRLYIKSKLILSYRSRLDLPCRSRFSFIFKLICKAFYSGQVYFRFQERNKNDKTVGMGGSTFQDLPFFRFSMNI